MKIHQINAEHLTIERIGEIIKENYKLQLSDDARHRIVRCREYLDRKIDVQFEVSPAVKDVDALKAFIEKLKNNQ